MDLLQALSGDVFKMEQMTAAINKTPHVPGRVGRLGVFQSEGVATRSIQLEYSTDGIALIPNTPLGAPPKQNKGSTRNIRNLVIPHFPLEDALLAAEIQGVRAFGGTELEGLEARRNQKLASMRVKHDATLEYGRLGAWKGIVLDSDGSTVIYNLFTEFGISQSSVDFVLGTATTEMLLKCYAVKRYIEDGLGSLTYEYVHVLCGKTWFERFTTHPVVKEAWKRYNASEKQRTDNRTGFEFGGIFFEEYRGKVGAVDFVADSEAHAAPIGVDGLFKTNFAPGDFVEAANTVGLPLYSKSERMEYDRGVKLLTESNHLSYCTRPEVLIKLTTGN